MFVGKILNDDGTGSDGDLIRGIDWAIQNGCAIISLSLGTPVKHNQPHSIVLEEIAKRALRRGTLIIAAAGNESRRTDSVQPVNHPANCPSFMAVAAVDQDLKVASFSNGGVNSNAGSIAISAPGVSVYSSYAAAPGPGMYRYLSGTSMAAPHVAGVAALWAERTGKRGQDLRDLITQNARRIRGAVHDLGAGLVQAPQS